MIAIKFAAVLHYLILFDIIRTGTNAFKCYRCLSNDCKKENKNLVHCDSHICGEKVDDNGNSIFTCERDETNCDKTQTINGLRFKIKCCFTDRCNLDKKIDKLFKRSEGNISSESLTIAPTIAPETIALVPIATKKAADSDPVTAIDATEATKAKDTTKTASGGNPASDAPKPTGGADNGNGTGAGNVTPKEQADLQAASVTPTTTGAGNVIRGRNTILIIPFFIYNMCMHILIK